MQNVNANSFHLHKARIMSGSLDLPDHFQVVVLGTGLVESVVAAAAARLGHTVLHIDTAGYYGGDFASFSLEGLGNWVRSQTVPVSGGDGTVLPELEPGEEYLDLGSFSTTENIKETWFVGDELEPAEPNHGSDPQPEATQEVGTGAESVPEQDNVGTKPEEKVDPAPKLKEDQPKNWTKDKLMKESRRFNLDLTPRLLYARGSMVELLISSNIARYTEFKSVTRVLTQIAGRLEHVPSSRADVFGTKHISVVEKRILMKFLAFCVNEKEEDILKGNENKPFREFLKAENLTENLVHFVVHSIAMVRPEVGTGEGIRRTRQFLSSLGRFGSTPFLWSMYGSGEIPQAFCRLCAVFGGIYYLGRTLSKLIIKDGRCVGIVTEGKRISCDFLVLPDKHTPDKIIPSQLEQVRTLRSMYIMSSSLLPTEKEQITLLSLPTQEPLHVIEVGPGTAACPKGLQVVHASTRDTGVDIDPLLRSVLPEPAVLYSLAFTQISRPGDVGTGLRNVYRAPGPLPELDFDAAVLQAEEIYKNMFPGEEFLPRAPDPEEIIIGEDNEETAAENPDNVDHEDSNTANDDTADPVNENDIKPAVDEHTKPSNDEEMKPANDDNNRDLNEEASCH